MSKRMNHIEVSTAELKKYQPLVNAAEQYIASSKDRMVGDKEMIEYFEDIFREALGQVRKYNK